MDFALMLFIALVVTGVITLYDRLVRRPRLAAVPGTGAPAEERREPRLIEYSKAFFPVILLVFLLRSFVVEPFRIPSGSMLPSLHIGDFILVNKFIYGIRLPIVNMKVIGLSEPSRGDVMVFRFPHDTSINYIKRVVGLPGDQILYKDKKVYVNGKPAEQKAAGSAEETSPARSRGYLQQIDEALGAIEHKIQIDPSRPTTNMSVTVPEGQYFVMGDNRDYSNDSRSWGFVSESNIIGRAFFIWFSWDHAHGGGPDWSRIGNSVK